MAMIDRRSVLIGLGAGALGGVAGRVCAADGELDLDDSGDFLTAVAKMRGSTDDRLVMGWVIGTRYAVVDHQATAMLGILAGTFSRYRRISADAYEAKSLELAYFTDLETGELLETWTNPFTNKTIKVPLIRMGPSTIIMRASGLTVTTAAGEAIGMDLRHRFMPAVTHRDEVWITEEIRVTGTPPGDHARPFSYNEMSTYQARKSDLDDPDQASVPTQVQFHSLVTFRPWMGFDGIKGHTTARGSGQRARRVEDFPAQYLELTERFHPDVLADPLAALADA